MTDPRQRTRRTGAASEASVWIDDDQALIFDHGINDKDAPENLERSPGETEPAFKLRTIQEIIERDRIIVSGPAVARLAFERAYAAMTHRPDRLVDVEPTTPPSKPVAPIV